MKSSARLVALLASFALACAPRLPHESAPQPAPDSAQASHYAIREMFPDSSEQARVRAFLDTLNAHARSNETAGNALGDLLFLRRLAARFRTSPAVQSFAAQQIAMYESFLGNDAAAVRLFDSLTTDGTPDTARPPTLGLDSLQA